MSGGKARSSARERESSVPARTSGARLPRWMSAAPYSEFKSQPQCMYYSALIAFQTLIWPQLYNQLTLKIINAL